MTALFLVTFGLLTLEKIFPEFIYSIFAYPSAWIASFFVGNAAVWTIDGDVVIPLSHQTINITPSCQGYGFFCLMSGFLFCRLGYKFLKGRLKVFLLLFFPFVYCLTIVTNGCRIVCAYYMSRVSASFLPGNFQASVHQGVGIIVFLTVIMFVSIFMERIGSYE